MTDTKAPVPYHRSKQDPATAPTTALSIIPSEHHRAKNSSTAVGGPPQETFHEMDATAARKPMLAISLVTTKRPTLKSDISPSRRQNGGYKEASLQQVD